MLVVDSLAGGDFAFAVSRRRAAHGRRCEMDVETRGESRATIVFSTRRFSDKPADTLIGAVETPLLDPTATARPPSSALGNASSPAAAAVVSPLPPTSRDVPSVSSPP